MVRTTGKGQAWLRLWRVTVQQEQACTVLWQSTVDRIGLYYFEHRRRMWPRRRPGTRLTARSCLVVIGVLAFVGHDHNTASNARWSSQVRRKLHLGTCLIQASWTRHMIVHHFETKVDGQELINIQNGPRLEHALAAIITGTARVGPFRRRVSQIKVHASLELAEWIQVMFETPKQSNKSSQTQVCQTI